MKNEDIFFFFKLHSFILEPVFIILVRFGIRECVALGLTQVQSPQTCQSTLHARGNAE